MSWWISLKLNGDIVSVSPHYEGATIAIGGEPTAELNVTYNYSGIIKEALGYGFRALNGRRAGDVISDLTTAVQLLGDNPDEDYWAPTNGNVGHMLNILLGWATMYPDAIFEVS